MVLSANLPSKDKKSGRKFWKRLINVPITDFNESYSFVEPVALMIGSWNGKNDSIRDDEFHGKTDTDSIPDDLGDSEFLIH